MSRQAHRWVIDSIADQVAVIEVDGEQTVHLPRWVIPRGAVEGQVLTVQHDLDPGGQHSVLHIAIDRAATDSALRDSQAQVGAIRKASGRHDPGGDISL
ncbi:MAG: DUF3006 domain-containing protein [Gemmatimonadaceae bacterium]